MPMVLFAQVGHIEISISKSVYCDKQILFTETLSMAHKKVFQTLTPN